MTIDVNAWIGGFPFRHVADADAATLVAELEREGVAGAWVGHLSSAFWRDPTPGNEALYEALASYDVLHPAPCIRPDWPGWERQLRDAVDLGVPALRAYPAQWGMGPGDPSLARLGAAAASGGVALVLTVRFEDLRQRHPLDVSPDLSAAHVRALVRDTPARVVVTHAGRELIEEIAWSLTDAERARVWFDISCVWGPPEDHLATLFRTLGASRFLYGSGWPLRLAQTPSANLALLPDDVKDMSLADAEAVAGSSSRPS